MKIYTDNTYAHTCVSMLCVVWQNFSPPRRHISPKNIFFLIKVVVCMLTGESSDICEKYQSSKSLQTHSFHFPNNKVWYINSNLIKSLKEKLLCQKNTSKSAVLIVVDEPVVLQWRNEIWIIYICSCTLLRPYRPWKWKLLVLLKFYL